MCSCNSVETNKGSLASIDSDGDGWTDSRELQANTDPNKKDTDNDGYWDSKDINPLDPNVSVKSVTLPTQDDDKGVSGGETPTIQETSHIPTPKEDEESDEPLPGEDAKSTADVDSDTTPPTLLEFSFTPASIDTSSSDQVVTFNLRASDDLSGLSGVYWYIQHSSGKERSGQARASQRISGDELDGTYRATVSFPQHSDEGTWHIVNLVAGDNTANHHEYTENELKSLGFPTELEVTGSDSDTTPPTLLEFSFTPASIDTSSSDQVVTFNLRASDDLSGLSGVYWYIQHSSGKERSGQARASQRISGDELDGTYRATVSFPQHSDEGTWHIVNLVAGDNTANHHEYTENELKSLGYQTELVISSNQNGGNGMIWTTPISVASSGFDVWGGTWYTGPPEYSIDGNEITAWTLNAMGEITFDLGSSKLIGGIEAYWQGSVTNGNCVNIYIDGIEVIHNEPFGATHNTRYFEPINGRYIKYQTVALPHNELLQIASWSEIAEFKVLIESQD